MVCKVNSQRPLLNIYSLVDLCGEIVVGGLDFCLDEELSESINESLCTIVFLYLYSIYYISIYINFRPKRRRRQPNCKQGYT